MIVTSGHLGHMICNYWSWYFYRDLPYKFRDTVFKIVKLPVFQILWSTLLYPIIAEEKNTSSKKNACFEKMNVFSIFVGVHRVL